MKIRSFITFGLLGLAVVARADYDFLATGDEPFAFSFRYGVGLPGGIPNGTMATSLFSSLGNPGGMYELKGTFNSGAYELVGGMSPEQWNIVSTTDDYVQSIDVTTDYRKNVAGADLAPQIIVTQGTKTYVAEIANNSGTTLTWLSATRHLVSSDFYEIPGPFGIIGNHIFTSHPDFGPNSLPLDIFLGQDVFSTTNTASASKYVRYDNFNVHVSTVPEPASIFAIFLGIAGMGLRRRRAVQS